MQHPLCRAYVLRQMDPKSLYGGSTRGLSYSDTLHQRIVVLYQGRPISLQNNRNSIIENLI